MPGPNVPFPPMEAELVDELPQPDGWQYEPKWDGFEHGGNQVSPVSPLLKQLTRFPRRGSAGQSPAPPTPRGEPDAGT